MTKGHENYTPIVASAHEVMRQAMLLCEEAREIEKSCDGESANLTKATEPA